MIFLFLDKAKLKGERKSRVKEETLQQALFNLFAVQPTYTLSQLEEILEQPKVQNTSNIPLFFLKAYLKMNIESICNLEKEKGKKGYYRLKPEFIATTVNQTIEEPGEKKVKQ